MAAIASPKALLTFEEYLAYDDGSDRRYELVDGELVEMPPESPENLKIARFLLAELMKYLPLQRIAYNTEIEVTGRRARCRVPDLLVHSEESWAALAGAAIPQEAASWVCGDRDSRDGYPTRGCKIEEGLRLRGGPGTVCFFEEDLRPLQPPIGAILVVEISV